MSIRVLISEWVKTGELVLVAPAFDSIPAARYVFATSEVMGALAGPWKDRKDEAKFGRVRAYIDTFISGAKMGIRMPPSKSVRAQIALLDEHESEVWELRVRDPKPGVRIFGRFCEKDVFVCLTVILREHLETKDDWKAEIERCKREWRKYFPTYQPLSGDDPNDYISNVFLV